MFSRSGPLSTVLHSWLDMTSIGRLDSALCSRDLRGQFLVSLRCWKLYNGVGAGTTSDVYIDWLLLRGMTVVKLHADVEDRVGGLNREYSDDDMIVEREALYQRILAVYPLHLSFLLHYAFLLHSKGDPDGAEAMYKRVLDIDPGHVKALCNFGCLLHDKGDVDGAEAMYKRVLDINPGHVSTLCNYGLLLHIKRRDLVGAEVKYKKALETDSNARELPFLLNSYGFLLEDSGDLDGAEAMYKRALEIDPNHIGTLYMLSKFLKSRRGDVVDTEAMYKKALNSVDVAKVLNCGRILMSVIEDFSGAMTMFERVLELDPNNLLARMNIEKLKKM